MKIRTPGKKTVIVIAAIFIASTLGGAAAFFFKPIMVWPLSLMFPQMAKTEDHQPEPIRSKVVAHGSNENQVGELRGSISDTSEGEGHDPIDGGGHGESIAAAAVMSFLPPVAQSSRTAQLIRKLQFAQDRLANGNSDAVLLQRENLIMLGEAFSGIAVKNSSLSDVLAACAYLLSGGRPDVVEKFLEVKILPLQVRNLLQGVLAYTRGDQAEASSLLHDLDPRQFSPMIAGHLAMVKARVDANATVQQRMLYLLYTANQLPGTLLEEASLRRIIELSAKQSNRKSFLAAVTRYNRRFSKSIYSREYGEALINGIFVFAEDKKKPLSEHDLDALIFQQSQARRNELLERISEFAIRRGDVPLCLYATARVRRLSQEKSATWTRAILHNVACSVVTGHSDTTSNLGFLDRNLLSSNDMALFDSALRLQDAIRSRELNYAVETHEKPNDSQPDELAATRDMVKSELQLSEKIISESLQ